MVPWLMALMGWSFMTYLLLKGLNPVRKISTQTAMLLGMGMGMGMGVAVAVLVFVGVRRALARHAATLTEFLAHFKEASVAKKWLMLDELKTIQVFENST